jgi:hypothetical protein
VGAEVNINPLAVNGKMSNKKGADDNGIPPAHAVNINYIGGQRQPSPLRTEVNNLPFWQRQLYGHRC